MLVNLRPHPIANHLAKVLSAVGSIALLVFQGFVLAMSSRGLDLTDEGYYLNSISWASQYEFGVSGFGSFYSIFFDLLGQNLLVLRTVTLLTNWVLWVTLGLVTLRLVTSMTGDRFDWTMRFFFSLASGALSLLVLNLWLPTPSYNTLAFQAVTIFVCGLLTSRIWGRIGLPVIGVGLFLSFVAKPTTTVFLVAILALVILRKSRAALFDFIASGIVALGLLFAWALYLDGSVFEYINRLAIGLSFTSLLDGGQIVWSDNWASALAAALWPFAGLSVAQIAYIAFAALSLLSLFLNRLFGPASNPGVQRFIYVLGSSGFLISLVLLYMSREPGYFGQVTVVGFLAILLTVVFVVAYRGRDLKFLDQSLVNSANLRLVVGIGLTPLAFAFGTNNNYWQASSAVGGMYFLSAALVVLFIDSKNFVGSNSTFGAQLILVGAGIAVATTTVIGAMNFPYRQTSPVYEMVPSSQIPGIFVGTETEKYFQDLSNIEEASGFQRGTPLIDNTGASPTAIYIIGGLPLGSAWLIGGYPGSGQLAEAQLRLYSQQCLDSAWILDEPTAARRVFSFNSKSFSLAPSNTYEALGYAKNPLTGGTQILYRPSDVSPVDSRACSQDR
jgi:hypothetical protein